MEITLFGTGAADGIPALFGDDRVSAHARSAGGRDVRSRASAAVDGVLKLDLPPETLAQCHRLNADASAWRAILFTHSDDDHFARNQLQYALYPFTPADHPAFSIHADRSVLDAIRTRYPEWPFELHPVRAFEPFVTLGYEVLPIRANHSPDEECLNFVLRQGGHGLLYATDTGVYGDESFRALAGLALDLAVIECTDGRRPGTYEGHLSIHSLVGVVERLRAEGALRPDARVVTTHHSARGDATHDELVAALAPHRIEPGYDGLSISLP